MSEKIVQISDESYNFNLEQYSGPLDLLLHLSRTKEIDIAEVKINDLIDQYIIFIKTLEKENINVAATYLEMMAELIRIKSKMGSTSESGITRRKRIKRSPIKNS